MQARVHTAGAVSASAKLEQSDKAVAKTAFTTEGLPASQQFDAYPRVLRPGDRSLTQRERTA